MKKTTYVFGHKNPDTDSIVSAWCFAALKNACLKRDGLSESYVAARAGKLSPQTQYIFDRFLVEPPEFHGDLSPKVLHFMSQDFASAEETLSLQAASSLMYKNDYHFLFITDGDGRFKGLLHYSVFARNLIYSLNPEHHIKVFTNRNLLRESLGAILACDVELFKEDGYSSCTIVAAASNLESFKKTVDSRKDQNLIVVCGDRDDIVEYAIKNRVYCVIVSGGRSVSQENLKLAVENKVCVLVSPFDTASTSMLIAWSAPVSKACDCSVQAVKRTDSVNKVKILLKNTPGHILPVVDDDNKIIGSITENQLLGEPDIAVSLVDHNELSQAVDGIENFPVKEIIDHHRIGTFSTKSPVTFINKVVGSTATIIAGLYQEEKIPIDRTTAALLLSGILSDTLILKSATTTETDIKTADMLAKIADLNVQEYGREILEAGSRLGNRSASDIVLMDMKQYNEFKFNFIVSQIETGNPSEVLSRKDEILSELKKCQSQKNLDFAALLVTDITRLDSILILLGSIELEQLLNYPKVEDNAYFMKGIVSRKKQLIPLLSEVLRRI